MKIITLLIGIALQLNTIAQNPVNITPEPLMTRIKKGEFLLSKKTTIIYDKQTENSKNYLTDYLKKFYKIKPLTSNQYPKKGNTIEFKFTAEGVNSSQYQLSISDKKITITGNAEGIFNGVQTLIQLLPLNNKKIEIQALEINDAPRFTYRGMHLDVGRHFFSVDFVKKYIDFLALHKFNTLHWHLTEDQGWRIEIKKYPLLTQTGSCRNQTLIGPYGTGLYDEKKYCGFYTQEQIKEIVKYASARYINIIPEIEMPGHSMAALSSYPFLGCTKGPYKVMETWGVSDDVLCAGNDSTFTFLENVLDEVMQIFPSKIIHIGGDECPKERWLHCAWCQKRMKENNLKNEHELQSYFIARIEKYLNSKGRNIIGWDEILEGGLAPNATVMSWRGEDGAIAAAKSHHNAIMTPGTPVYFDHSQSKNEDSLTIGGYNSLKMVYDFEPIPTALNKKEATYILGAQANMWTEYMDNEKKVEYMLFPRLTALAEVLWSPKTIRDWEKFEMKIPGIFERYNFWKVNFSRAYYDIQPTITTDDNKGINWKLISNYPDGMIYVNYPNSNVDIEYRNPVPIATSGNYKAVIKDKKGKYLSAWMTQEFHINKATGRKIEIANPPSNSYAVGGVITLVDGIHNTKGMSKSSQFLGFAGTDLIATIDLGDIIYIDSLKLHAFEQNVSWIYRPSQVSVYESKNGIDFELSSVLPEPEGKSNLIYKAAKPIKTRFLKIVAQNFGMIPSGMPGAGNKAWLFVDEIEVF